MHSMPGIFLFYNGRCAPFDSLHLFCPVSDMVARYSYTMLLFVPQELGRGVSLGEGNKGSSFPMNRREEVNGEKSQLADLPGSRHFEDSGVMLFTSESRAADRVPGSL